MYVSAYQEKQRIENSEFLDPRVLTQAKDALTGQIPFVKVQEYDDLLQQMQSLRDGEIAEQQVIMDRQRPTVIDFFANNASPGAQAVVGESRIYVDGDNVVVAPLIPL